jgi:hypothetical protein
VNEKIKGIHTKSSEVQSEDSRITTKLTDLPVNEDETPEVKGGAFVGGWGSSAYQYAFDGNR